MVIENTNTEYLIRISNKIDIQLLQKLLENFEFFELQTQSKANEDDIKLISDEISTNWWNENKFKYV